MAAIDKLYVHSYYEFNDLRTWALVYYPKLLLYFYDYTLTEKEYLENRTEWVKQAKAIHLRDKARFGNYETKEQAIQNLIAYYKQSANYDCPLQQAEDEYNHMSRHDITIDHQLECQYSFPVMNTPLKVDRILKWRCPVPCVREYLHKQCGVNMKYEWFYRLFWKGKKHF